MSELFLGAHIPDDITQFAMDVGPEPDSVLAEMERRAETEGFPIVGPAVGGWLSQLVRITGARRVFEFGSGFGYSACWFARALPDDGEIVLTELDAAELDQAREYLARSGARDRATFEAGDAVETARRYDDEFDIILLDIEKYEYVDAFEAMRENVPPGGMVVADNVMTAGREEVDDTVDYTALRQVLADPNRTLDDVDIDESAKRGTQGVLDYFAHVTDASEFETTLLPLGDGVAVTTRLRE